MNADVGDGKLNAYSYQGKLTASYIHTMTRAFIILILCCLSRGAFREVKSSRLRRTPTRRISRVRSPQ